MPKLVGWLRQVLNQLPCHWGTWRQVAQVDQAGERVNHAVVAAT